MVAPLKGWAYAATGAWTSLEQTHRVSQEIPTVDCEEHEQECEADGGRLCEEYLLMS